MSPAEGRQRASRIRRFGSVSAGTAPPPARSRAGGSGPVLVLARHASLVDSLLPRVLMEDFELRYVLKRELRWNPCLDIVGARLPNAFVLRSSWPSPGRDRQTMAARGGSSRPPRANGGVGDTAEIERVAAPPAAHRTRRATRR